MRDGVHTLRGMVPVNFGAAATFGNSSLSRLFQYQSSDRTRGWRVRFAAAWVNETFTSTGGGDSRACLSISLATDSLTADGTPPDVTNADTARAWQKVMSPEDNRTIAWGVQDYQNRDNVSADFTMPTSGMRSQCELITDFERMVTSELWLAAFAVTDASTGTYDVAYYIELEQVKISENESVLQLIKGMGQDIGAPLLVEDT